MELLIHVAPVCEDEIRMVKNESLQNGQKYECEI